MIKNFKAKKLLALILSVLIVFASIPTMFIFAEDGVVTFTAQTIAEGFKHDVIKTAPAGTVTMPSVGPADQLRTGYSITKNQRPANCEVSGWLWEGKYYEVGEVVENIPAGAQFTAVYGDNTANFDDVNAGKVFYAAGNVQSYGAEGVTIAQVEGSNNCLQFVGQTGDSQTSRQGAILYKNGSDDRIVCYTPNAQYKVTFKYRRTDKIAAESKIYLVFGMYLCDWYANNQAKSKVELVTTKTGMTDFETVTAIVTAPANYSHTASGLAYASKAIGFRVMTTEGVTVQIDDVKIETSLGKTVANFTYGEGAATAVGSDTFEVPDKDGNITLPVNNSAMNLLWENNGLYYAPGTKVNVNSLGGNLTFKAFFGAANINYENICTNSIKLADGASTENLYKSISRNPSYWKVPSGLSNTAPDGSNRYGLALGHDRVGIVPSQGVNSSKALALRTNKNGSYNLYRSAALFSHTPTSFTVDSQIAYSYVYYTPNTEYTIEFDYKTVTEVTATISFGVNTNPEYDDSKQSTSVNSDIFGTEGTYVTLPATNGEWKHASVTVTSPAAYTGNDVTSARVGIALKDNEAPLTDAARFNYFDNVEFYPTTLGEMKFDYVELKELFDQAPSKTAYARLGNAKTPTVTTDTASRVRGTNANGYWYNSYGDVSVTGFLCNETGKVFGIGETISGVPANATFTAVYGNNTADFNDLATDFVFNSGNNEKTYGSKKATITDLGDGNHAVLLQGTSTDNLNYQQFLPVNKVGSSSDYRFIGYNKNTTYKVSFKYRRTDNEAANSDLYVAFGAVSGYWLSESRAISKIKVAATNKNMTEFETVTAFVTASDSYTFGNEGGSDYISKAVGLGATLSNGVKIEIDDFVIESAMGSSYVVFDENIGDNATTDYTVTYENPLTILPVPTYEGYEFCGWYDNRMGYGDAVTFVTGNGSQKTYYAKWVPVLGENGAAIKIAGASLSDYQLVLPENKTLVLSDSLSAFKNLVLSKGATTGEKSNKIIVEDTSDKTIVNGNSSYTIKVENNNLIIEATDDAAMAGALDRLSQFIETAYEMDKVLNFASDFNFTQKYVADDSQYSYSWSDEFSAEDLDKSTWLYSANYREPEVGGYQIGENNWFTGDPDEENETSGRYDVNTQGIFVEDGKAVVRAEKVDGPDAAGNKSYFINRDMSTIGAVEYTYGCIEIKAKLPAHPAAPQLWIYSSRDVATSAEIDLHEGVGTVSGYANNQQIVSNLHASYHLSSDENKWASALDASQPLNSNNSNRIYLGNTKTNYDEDYHIYSVRWTPDEVVFALDGEVYYTYNFNTDTDLINNATTYDGTSPFEGLTSEQIKECFSKQMYINIGNTMGTREGAYGPVYENGDAEQADLLVDYVRVYQSADNEGSTFMNRPYSQEQIIEVEKSEKAFIKEMGIEDRGDTTKTVVMSGEGIETETIKINVGDSLPVNYEIGSKYIIGWTDGENSVKTYTDSSKTYTPQFIDLSMLDVSYKVSESSDDTANVLFMSTVDANWSDYSKAGFVYSESQATPTIGAKDCASVETTKVYEDGLLSGSNLLNCADAGYTAYSKYMFNFALKDIALSGRANDINVRSYVVLSDGRVVYGDVLTINAEDVLIPGEVSEFDSYIIERLAKGATLDNLVDYNNDKCFDVRDLVRAKKIAVGIYESNEEVTSITLTNIRKVFLLFNDSKIK